MGLCHGKEGGTRQTAYQVPPANQAVGLPDSDISGTVATPLKPLDFAKEGQAPLHLLTTHSNCSPPSGPQLNDSALQQQHQQQSPPAELNPASTSTPISQSGLVPAGAALVSPQAALADVKLTNVLGAGSFGQVIKGIWRSSTPVAVKLILTSCTQFEAEDAAVEAALPATALREVILTRGLSHPHIIRCFDVRSCKLTPEFVEAAVGSSMMASGLLDTGMMASSHLDTGVHATVSGMHSSHPEAAAVLPATGLTPLRAAPQKHASHAGGSMESASDDGYGLLAQSADGHGISWYELLLRMHAAPGDWLTVIIMQLAHLGTLQQAIEKGAFLVHPNMSDTDRRRRRRALLRTAHEIAQGLEYLHASSVAHADLKPGNILLDDSKRDARGFTALVADFGLSLMVSHSKAVPGSGTTQYMAPEVFMSGQMSHASDIYSFGIVLWEMATGKHAFEGMSIPQIVMAVGSAGERPAGIEQHMPDLLPLYDACVHEDPAQRPTAAQLVEKLTALEHAAHKEARAEAKASKQRQQPTPA